MAMISYVPPGVYTETKFQPPLPLPPVLYRTPLLIGTGSETLTRTVSMVRGLHQGSMYVGEEFVTDSFVYLDPVDREVIIPEQKANGDFRVFQVKYYPIVTEQGFRSDGSKDITNERSDIQVTVNGIPAVVEAMDGARGLVRLVNAPAPTDDVRCSYHFARTDTFSRDDLSSQIKNKNWLVLPRLVSSNPDTYLLSTLTSVKLGSKDYSTPDLGMVVGALNTALAGFCVASVNNGYISLATDPSKYGITEIVDSECAAFTADGATDQLILTAIAAPVMKIGDNKLIFKLNDLVKYNANVAAARTAASDAALLSGADAAAAADLAEAAVPGEIVEKTVLLPAYINANGTSTIEQVKGYFNSLSTTGSLVEASQVTIGINDTTTSSDYVEIDSDQILELVVTITDSDGNPVTEFNPKSEPYQNTKFYTLNNPLRTGKNNGKLAKKSDVYVYVNDRETPLPVGDLPKYYSVDSETGVVELEDIVFTGVLNNEPLTKIEVSYAFNRYENYFDFLPDSGVVSLDVCGTIPSKQEYLYGSDFVLVSNPKDTDRIVWGNAVIAAENIFSGESPNILSDNLTSSYLPFDSRQFSTLKLVEYDKLLEQASPTLNPSVYTISKIATLGDTSGTSLADNAPDSISNYLKVYVATDAVAAQAVGIQPAEVVKVNVNSLGKFEVHLKNPPAANKKVFVSYKFSNFWEMNYAMQKENDRFFTAVYSPDGFSTSPIHAVTTPVRVDSSGYVDPARTSLNFISRTTLLRPKFEKNIELKQFMDPSLYVIQFDAGSRKAFKLFTASYNPNTGVVSTSGTALVSGISNQSTVYRNFTFAIPDAASDGAQYVFEVSPNFEIGFNHQASIPGVEFRVSDMTSVKVGDSARVSTFDKAGSEPELGSTYWLTYTYAKKDYSTRIFSKLSDVVAEYGAATPENPVSLGASLAFSNGAGTVAIKQIKKDMGLKTASTAKYLAAIDEVEGTMPNGGLPAYIVPLVGVDGTILQKLAKHCDDQSSLRFRAERNALVGVPGGTLGSVVKEYAEATSASRIRIVYPDSLLLTTVNNLGVRTQHLVPGCYAAAALAGRVCAKNTDAATPWDRKPIVGFDSIARKLNRVQMDEIASSGITLLEQSTTGMFVRHGLTTDISNILTKNPTVTQIVDEVHQRSRGLLDTFIGVKFMPSVLGDIESKFTGLLASLRDSQIIMDFKEVVVLASPEDPQAVDISVFIAPVLPLLYINVKFTMRVTL